MTHTTYTGSRVKKAAVKSQLGSVDPVAVSVDPDLRQQEVVAHDGDVTTAVRHSVDRVKRKTTYAEEEEVIVYDLKTKLSSRGKIVEVLGNNNYLVDCGKGSQHISGDILSKAKAVTPPHMNNSDGDQMLTADADNLAQEDIEPASDSSSEDEDGYTEVVPAAVPRRRRRVRAEMLGPIVQHRLRQRR